MRSALLFGAFVLICQWKPSWMEDDSRTKWVEKKYDDSCPQQSEDEKNCVLEREQLRQRVVLCDTLKYTVDLLHEELNTSREREEKFTSLLQRLSNRLDEGNYGSKPSTGAKDEEPLPWTKQQGEPGSPSWYFLKDTSRLEVYTFAKEDRYAKRQNNNDLDFLPLFVRPVLEVGKVYEASFRIWRPCDNSDGDDSVWMCSKDGVAIGVNAGIDEGEQQVWSSHSSLVLRSFDGSVYEKVKKSPEFEWSSYIGRPLVSLDVVTVKVDLTLALPVVQFALNGEFGRKIILYLPNEKIKQLRFVVETFAEGATVEII